MGKNRRTGIARLFTDKQLAVLEYNNRVQPAFLLNDGAIRSGKTFGTVSPFIAHVAGYKNKGYDFIMLGHSIGALERNVLSVFREYYGIDATLDKFNSFKLFGNKINCFGGSDRDARNSIQGMTGAGAYANELTLIHEDAVKETIGRCSIPGARFFFEMNPGIPTQYFYKEYIMPAERNGNGAEVARFSWTIEDNAKETGGFLTREYIDRLKRTYKGLWFKKYILGEWAAFEGQIYFLENLKFYDDSVLTDALFFQNAIIHGFTDPAAGSTKKTGCFTTIITGARKDDRIYILDVHLKKTGVVETIAAAGERLRKYRYASFRYESSFTQDEYFGGPLKRAFPFAPIQGQAVHEDKLSRLIGMANVVTEKVYFPERFLYEHNTDGNLLLQQLINISKDRTEKADSDETYLDGPDAIEGLIRSFRNYEIGGDIMAAGDVPDRPRIW